MRRFGTLLWASVVLVTGTAGLTLIVAPAPASADGRLDDGRLDLVPDSDPTALLLLHRAETAAYAVPFTGVRYLATWCPRGTTSAIADVSHVPGVGTTVSVRQTGADALGAGSAGHIVRGPGRERALTEGLVARNFRVVLAGMDKVAGRSAAIVEARQPVTDAVVARMWLDTETGLVLRQEVFDSHGAVVRADGFLAIKVDRPVRAGSPAPPTEPPVAPDALAAGNTGIWTAPAELPYALRLYQLRQFDHPSGMIVHASYSDGLSTASVFVQRGRLDPQALTGYTRVRYGDASVYVYDGTPRRVMWAADGSIYTILTDGPEEMIQAVVTALPSDTGDDGVLDRMGRGLARVGSWFNPFG
ncbi:MAG: hypothetical protein L0Y54_09455 [Sporichthyaceae bacterium]|nr:hypothetical protein [Sporichthyaceae bacterium]